MREAAHDALAFIIIWTIVSAVTLTILAVIYQSVILPKIVRWWSARKSK